MRARRLLFGWVILAVIGVVDHARLLEDRPSAKVITQKAIPVVKDLQTGEKQPGVNLVTVLA